MSDFVDPVLSQAGEKYDHQYESIHQGYDLNRITSRVAEIYQMDPDEIYSKGNQEKMGQSWESSLLLGCSGTGYVPHGSNQASRKQCSSRRIKTNQQITLCALRPPSVAGYCGHRRP